MTQWNAKILESMPYQAPFRFVDAFEYVDEHRVKGHYTFHPELDFYRGHFPGNPITPGVILIECMAQIGLVGMGLFIKRNDNIDQLHQRIAMTSADVNFLKPVYPGTRVSVESQRIYYRLGKLKAKVRLTDGDGDICSEGEMSGILINNL